MKYTNLIASAVIAYAGLVGGANALEESAQIKLGQMEYVGSCAACHGANGKGDGPVAEVLS